MISHNWINNYPWRAWDIGVASQRSFEPCSNVCCAEQWPYLSLLPSPLLAFLRWSKMESLSFGDKRISLSCSFASWSFSCSYRFSLGRSESSEKLPKAKQDRCSSSWWASCIGLSNWQQRAQPAQETHLTTEQTLNLLSSQILIQWTFAIKGIRGPALKDESYCYNMVSLWDQNDLMEWFKKPNNIFVVGSGFLLQVG